MIKISNPSTRADYADNADGSHIMLHIGGLTVHREDAALFLLHGVTFATVDDKLLAQSLNLNPDSLTDQHKLDKVLTYFQTMQLAEALAERMRIV